MPLKIYINGMVKNITPKTTFSAIRFDNTIDEIRVDPGYYVNPVRIKAR
jgi:hypothetical protein